MWFSVACFDVRVAVMFRLMFVHYTFSSVWVAELSPFAKKLPTRSVICSHCLLSICHFYFPYFGFKGGVRLLIAPISVHCFMSLCPEDVPNI